MKSMENIIYQRDIVTELAKLSINKLIQDLKSEEKDFDTHYMLQRITEVQTIINSAKLLDWIVNCDDDANIDDYYGSQFEIELEAKLNIEKLNLLIGDKF